jgi:beta-glucanase (GH16 family)
MAVGGNWPGSPNSSTQFPQTFEIDYVRVYDKTSLPYLSGAEKVIQNSAENLFKVESPEAGSTYEWSLPEGASITEGNGTNTIKVKWGLNGGLVKVKVKSTCGESEFSLAVKAEGDLKKK